MSKEHHDPQPRSMQPRTPSPIRMDRLPSIHELNHSMTEDLTSSMSEIELTEPPGLPLVPARTTTSQEALDTGDPEASKLANARKARKRSKTGCLSV